MQCRPGSLAAEDDDPEVTGTNDTPGLQNPATNRGHRRSGLIWPAVRVQREAVRRRILARPLIRTTEDLIAIVPQDADDHAGNLLSSHRRAQYGRIKAQCAIRFGDGNIRPDGSIGHGYLVSRPEFTRQDTPFYAKSNGADARQHASGTAIPDAVPMEAQDAIDGP
jgi:hypothetical protein